MIELLVERGGNPGYRNKYGRTPLEIARERCLGEIIGILESKDV